jgi:hypothetical protein
MEHSLKIPSLAQKSETSALEAPAKVFSRGPGSSLKYGGKPKVGVTSKRVSNRGSRLRKEM